MVHNLTQGLLDIISGLGSLGKTKVSTLANAIVDVMDEENDLRSIVVNENMRKALVAMLFRENASAEIIGATLVSSTVALLYIQELGNLNIDSALLRKIISIVYSKLSVNEEDIKALLTQVNIDISLVKSIREVAIAPKAGQKFAAKLVIDGVDLIMLSNIQQKFVVENILKIYAQQLKLDVSKFAIVVSLNKSNSSGVKKAPMVSREGVVRVSGVPGQRTPVMDIDIVVAEAGVAGVAGVDDDAAAEAGVAAAGVADAGLRIDPDVAYATMAGVPDRIELDDGATATYGVGLGENSVVAYDYYAFDYATAGAGAGDEPAAGDELAAADDELAAELDAAAAAGADAELDAGAERDFRAGEMVPGNYTVNFGDLTIRTYTPLDDAMERESFAGATIIANVVDTEDQYLSGIYDYTQSLTITPLRDDKEVANSGVYLGFNPPTATWQQINVDENGDLAQKYGIRGIPTMIFFKNGEAAKTLVGVQPKEEIKKSLEELA